MHNLCEHGRMSARPRARTCACINGRPTEACYNGESVLGKNITVQIRHYELEWAQSASRDTRSEVFARIHAYTRTHTNLHGIRNLWQLLAGGGRPRRVCTHTPGP